MISNLLTWLGIGFCITQSAFFSGMNLAVFSVSRLRLEIEASMNVNAAMKLLALRNDANLLLTTILWGNVGINVLLTLLSNSLLTGLSAFLFSTLIITFVGEIAPQAYFSRHALRMAARLSFLLRFYQILLYPVAKPTALFLDWWLGKEGVRFFQERELRQLIKMHIESSEVDVDRLEGLGAMNFLKIDDLKLLEEGETIDPHSIIQLPVEAGKPVFPAFSSDANDPFLKRVQRSGHKWVIITNTQDEPEYVLDADGFLRDALFNTTNANTYKYCHRPIIVRDEHMYLGKVLNLFKVVSKKPEDDVIDEDIILVWGNEKRVITGADILGRLMRGIVKTEIAM